MLGVIEQGFGDESTTGFMRVTTAKVVEGKVVVEGLPLEEGAVVTVLARERSRTRPSCVGRRERQNFYS
jgi:hypothetical protein